MIGEEVNTVGWFRKTSDLKKSNEILGVQLEQALKDLQSLKEDVLGKQHLLEESAKEIDKLNDMLARKQYDHIHFQTNGSGDLFRRMIGRQAEKGARFEKLSCPEMYLADRHSTIYELVEWIVIENITISNSHFEKACFDTVTFSSVVFEDVCFYKTWFENVVFSNCKFIKCDFTESQGENVSFISCTPKDTDLSLMKVVP